ncbi:MAG TPA: hypothetical protein VN700_09360 [Vicinamibacterales bacterium]|nr:hypothetical protein [Vicinamibacterales bacterium]
MIVERPGVERRILESLQAGRIPVLLGGCAIGRTSLLLRVQQQLGADRAQYVDFGAAATTPERCLAAVLASTSVRSSQGAPPSSTTPRAAFDSMLAYFDLAAGPGGATATFVIDEFLDVRTFENFPGLRQVVRDLVARLAASPTGFVLASRFTFRTHRLLRDAPARFEVVHIPPMTTSEVQAFALRFDGGRAEGPAAQAPLIAALTGGRAGYAHLLLEGLTAMGPATDPIAALASLFAPEGRMTARCRESYEFRLHRARGYGALKAILGILADDEPQNLTEIAHHLQRTPGSTKDYLSWLEDVDVISMHGKRYSYDDPLVRLYVRLYARPVPPTDADIVREVRAYAQARLPQMTPTPVAVTAASAVSDRTADAERASGIIEID